MPDAQKDDISGGGGVSAATGTGTLTDQELATRYNLTDDQIHAFCREFNVPKVGEHYAIAPAMLPQLERWVQEKGYGSSR